MNRYLNSVMTPPKTVCFKEGGMLVEEVKAPKATGTVEERDVFTVDDYEALQAVADEETAQLYVDRGEEPILVDATVTPTD